MNSIENYDPFPAAESVTPLKASDVEQLAARRRREGWQPGLGAFAGHVGNLVNKSLHKLDKEGISKAGLALRIFPVEVAEPFHIKGGSYNKLLKLGAGFWLGGGTATLVGLLTETFILYGGITGTLGGTAFLLLATRKTKEKQFVETRKRLTQWLQECGLKGFTITDSHLENLLHSKEAFQLVLEDKKNNLLYINSDSERKVLNRGRLVLSETVAEKNSKTRFILEDKPFIEEASLSVVRTPAMATIQSASLEILASAELLLARQLPVEYSHAVQRVVADVHELNRLYEKNHKSDDAEKISFDSLAVLEQEMESLTADIMNLGMKEMKVYQAYIQQRQNGFTIT